DSAVSQPLRVVPREDELHCAEEPLIELRLLVGKALPDAFSDANAAVFQFDDADGDPVQVKNDIGASLLAAPKGNLLSDGEVVFLRFSPVDEVDGLGGLSSLGLYRHPVSQQSVDGFIVVVEGAAMVVGLGAQSVKGTADLRRGIAVSGQIGRQQAFLDVAVAATVCPIAE